MKYIFWIKFEGLDTAPPIFDLPQELNLLTSQRREGKWIKRATLLRLVGRKEVGKLDLIVGAVVTEVMAE